MPGSRREESMSFQLVLFSTAPAFIREAQQGGVDAFIVDWECRGKECRQKGFDTEINRGNLEDLVRVRRSTDRTVLCRINSFGPETREEIETAIRGGADEILLPMVRSASEVKRALDRVAGRCGLGILVETREAVRIARELGALPLSRIYVGLNDLAICRGSRTIFDAVADGTVETVRHAFTIPFGFAGLTLPDRGSPLPCRLLISEMARLSCSFSFLRRSFHRDVTGREIAGEVVRLKAALRERFGSEGASLEQDHRDLVHRIRALRDDWGKPVENLADVPALGGPPEPTP